ncbi:Desiccation-like protein [Citrus sinensis]|nr:Desiccation-like protein [Citrus sinensis]
MIIINIYKLLKKLLISHYKMQDDVDNLQFAQNLEHLEAELFLGGGLGYGLDKHLVSPLDPPFYPYRDSLSYMVGSYTVPYVGLNGYTGSNPFLCVYLAKRLAAGLLSPESGQDRIVRGYLFGRADQIVKPYNYTVARFTTRISNLRNRLGMCGIKDEGLVAMSCPWAFNSFSYPRSPEEILRISYGTGNEHVPSGFFPQGGKWKNCKKISK